MASDNLEFAYLSRGKAYFAKNDYADAVTDLQKAVALKADDTDAQDALRLVLARQGNVQSNGSISTTPKTPSPECIANGSNKGSFLTGRMCKTWQQFPNVKPFDAYNRLPHQPLSTAIQPAKRT
jgi:tetratricopeptide (TPR) repeat protein